MNYAEAKHLLLIHGSGFTDVTGKPIFLEDGFLGSLRPYRGLRDQNFHSVMQALLVVGELWAASPMVDRDLIQSVWTICTRARVWGLDPNGMLQRNKLISADDVKKLDRWVHLIERTALGLLAHPKPWIWIDGYAEYLAHWPPGDNIKFFVPLMVRFLEDPETLEPTNVAAALGKLGKLAHGALPSLRAAARRKYSKWCDDEAHKEIDEAIRLIGAGQGFVS
jgi:hypothetical protein